MAKPRGQETVGDMLRSLAVVLAVVALFFLFFPHGHRNPVHPIDYSSQLTAARDVAHYDVLAPTGLSKGWRPTSARVVGPDRAHHVEFHIGFVTPDNRYAELEESDADPTTFVEQQVGTRVQPIGSLRIDGVSWQKLRDGRGELVLVRVSGQPAVLVTGSAGLAELSALAASLT